MARTFLQRSRHDTIFYFRRRIPLDLQQRLRQSQIYASLHTADKREAVILARCLATRTDLLFQAARIMDDKELDEKRFMEMIRQAKLTTSLRQQIDELKDELLDTHVDKNKQLATLREEHTEQLKALLAARPAGDPTAVRFTTMTVREAMEKMFAARGLKPRSQKRYRSIYADFASHVGWDTQLHEITSRQFAEYAHVIATDSKRKVATKRNYITIAARLFNWAHTRDDRIPLMAAKGLKPARKRPAYMDRPAHTMDEIGHLFKFAATYKDTEPHRFWATVAPAFLGCRIEELAQCNLNKDVKQHPVSGVWYLDMQEDEELSAHDGGKSLKKLSSWRQVPMHSALIEQGFLDYLAAERSRGAASPFERHWKPHRDSEGAVIRAHGIIKWGGRQLTRLRRDGLLATARTTYFHSMRHSLNALLVTKGVGLEWRAALCGQETTGGGVNTEVYSKLKSDPTALSGMIEAHLGDYVAMLKEAVST